MSNPPCEQHSEAAAWCQQRISELSYLILALPGPLTKITSGAHGAICRQTRDYAVTLRAAHLVTELGEETVEGTASVAEAFRQVSLLSQWLAEVSHRRLEPEAVPGPPDKREELPLRERVLTALTPQQGRILSFLLDKKSASFDTLRTIPDAWRRNKSPTDMAIVKAIEKAKERLETESIWAIELTISTAKKRVDLTVRPDRAGP